MVSTTQYLREILVDGKAGTQSEIKLALQERGIDISQSKVSRLLHQIGAVKIVDNHGKTHYRLPHETNLMHELTSPQEQTLVRQWVLNIIANNSLIIIHTTPGAAGMVARMIDLNRIALHIVGTIAGDDTIFVAPEHTDKITEIIHKITVLFNL